MSTLKRSLGLLGTLLLVFVAGACARPEIPPNGFPAALPLPSSLPLQDYESKLYQWLMTRQYQQLQWRRDNGVRDTGPFINTLYYGTHAAVRIYYSPEVVAWLERGREGELPDGSIIIKEMFVPPAVLYQDMSRNPKYQEPEDYEAFIDSMVVSWAVMVRDRAASKDGWFWANPAAPKEGEPQAAAIERQLDKLGLQPPPQSLFGAPCLRCHASAESQSTFSDTKNIEGFPTDEEPLRFLVDTSWRSADHFMDYPLSLLKEDPWVKQHFILPRELRPYDGKLSDDADLNASHGGAIHAATKKAVKAEALPAPNLTFVNTFSSIVPTATNNVLAFPSQWMDQVLPDPEHPQEYMSSDNCLGCHGGLGGEPYGVTMFVKTGPEYGDGYNLSEYGEWRWSPMGLAGRDPIFHAQLESEMVLLERDAKMQPTPLKGSLEDTRNAVTNTCLSCHGAMGQRQLLMDAAADPALNPNMSVDYFYLQPQLSSDEKPPVDETYLRYGQLAREGVSCTICHHIDKPGAQEVEQWEPPRAWLKPGQPKDLAYMLFHNNTGRYKHGPADTLFGPFEHVAQKPMENSLGVKPVLNEYTSDSQMCGTCHTINLPNIGASKERFPILNEAETNPAFKEYQHSIEQATFLEWQNSAFAKNEGVAGSKFASCQDCHMPGGFNNLDNTVKIDQLTTQIAAIQDVNLPEADNRLPDSDIDIPLRSDYKRHEHVGLNVFLLEMFDQFPQILGVDKTDYMTSATNGVDTAVDNMILQAQQYTAKIEVNVDSLEGQQLKATVAINNLTGHRFPSGVAFRRAFIEFAVYDGDEQVWASGLTNDVGVIVDGEGKPLKTEFLPDAKSFQPHHQTIERQDQVQIYEELNQNADREFTTSFIHRVFPIKDNRLLPDGWRKAATFKKDGELLFQFFEATDPLGTGDDPDYEDDGPGFKGGDRVTYEVTLPQVVQRENLSVRATLYSQSIPPSWLHQRFSTAPDGPATRRLYYMASHLNLEGTAMENWKLKLVSARWPDKGGKPVD